nr:uncharacterized protein LOC109772200 isoform X5 [Aegilops tauschii subsp. strangulata]
MQLGRGPRAARPRPPSSCRFAGHRLPLLASLVVSHDAATTGLEHPLLPIDCFLLFLYFTWAHRCSSLGASVRCGWMSSPPAVVACSPVARGSWSDVQCSAIRPSALQFAGRCVDHPRSTAPLPPPAPCSPVRGGTQHAPPAPCSPKCVCKQHATHSQAHLSPSSHTLQALSSSPSCGRPSPASARSATRRSPDSSASSPATSAQDNSTAEKLFCLVCSRQTILQEGTTHMIDTLKAALAVRHSRPSSEPSYRPEGTKASSFTYLALTRTAKSVLWPRSIFSASRTMWTPSRRPAGERPLCRAATSPCIP